MFTSSFWWKKQRIRIKVRYFFWKIICRAQSYSNFHLITLLYIAICNCKPFHNDFLYNRRNYQKVKYKMHVTCSFCRSSFAFCIWLGSHDAEFHHCTFFVPRSDFLFPEASTVYAHGHSLWKHPLKKFEYKKRDILHYTCFIFD